MLDLFNLVLRALPRIHIGDVNNRLLRWVKYAQNFVRVRAAVEVVADIQLLQVFVAVQLLIIRVGDGLKFALIYRVKDCLGITTEVRACHCDDTGLSISEALGLQWADIEHDRNRIVVRRSWVEEVGDCKNVHRKAPVAMHPVLGDYLKEWHRETMYGGPHDWVFASTKLKGAKPRCGSIASQTFLYPAAAKAGVFHSVEKRNRKGKLISVRYIDLSGKPIKRWGWHNLRHSLASWLVSSGVDVKTVSSMLRHSNIKTTLGIYSHAVDSNKLAAQGQFLGKLLAGGSVQ